MEIHSHAYAAAEEVGGECGVCGEGDHGCVVVGRWEALDPLFGEGAREACDRVGEEHGAHVAEEKDVHVKVNAAVEVEHDEADGIGDLNGCEAISGVEGEPVLVVCVLDYFVGDVGFVGSF